MSQIAQTTREIDGTVYSAILQSRLGLVFIQSCIGTKSKQVLIIRVSVTIIRHLAVYFQILLVRFAPERILTEALTEYFNTLFDLQLKSLSDTFKAQGIS